MLKRVGEVIALALILAGLQPLPSSANDRQAVDISKAMIARVDKCVSPTQLDCIEAITIIPGVADGDQYWICEESWETRYVEGSMIFIEVVVSCTSCKRGIVAPQRDCLDCDGAGEWVFLPSNLTRNF